MTITPMKPASPQRKSVIDLPPPPAYIPKKIFRFLSNEDYADQFAMGNIRISTLETCRQYEDPLQGDSGEGSSVYRGGIYKNVNGDHPGFLQDAARSGIHFHGDPSEFTNISISGAKREFRINDALVLCTTAHFDPTALSDTFGKYVVEINDVPGFFTELTQALVDRYPILKFYARPVHYRSREFDSSQAPSHEGFIKPTDPYAPQQEFRMLWTVRPSTDLTPGNVFVPELAKYCQRIA